MRTSVDKGHAVGTPIYARSAKSIILQYFAPATPAALTVTSLPAQLNINFAQEINTTHT